MELPYKTMKEFEMVIKYEGYEGVNLDRFSINHLNNLKKIIPLINNNPEYMNLDKILKNLPNYSIDEIRELTKIFCSKYFSLNDISIIGEKELSDNSKYISLSSSPTEVYEKVNSLLTTISPTDIKIDLISGHAMIGNIKKPILIVPEYIDAPNRKLYFSSIELGNELNGLSVGTMVHEIAHSQQEQNLGYAKDYLNKEIISIFLEKVATLETDPTGNLLKLSERVRFLDLMNRYLECFNPMHKLSEVEKIDNLLYIKSILYSIKLFDMYMNERKQKNRDKYFYDIQKVFNGQITVDDMIKSRNITINQCQDLSLLKKRI